MKCSPAGWTAAAACVAVAAIAAAAPTAPATAPAAEAAEDARYAETVFQSVYGAECRQVAATATTTDDVELAGRILKGAANADPQPALQVLLCEKAYELGAKAPGGYETAISAMRLLGRKQPDKEGPCWEKILPLLQRRYARAVKFPKLEAGERLLIELTRRAERMRHAGNYDEALLLLRKALPIARMIRSPHGRVLLEMLKYLTGRSRFARQAAAAEAQLKARPQDSASRQALVRLYLVELDRPARAAELVNEDCDEVTRTYVPLAARPVDTLDPNVWPELGAWYKSLAAGTSADAKMLLYRRAAGYLGPALERLPARTVQHMKAKLALQDVAAFLHAARQRYPLKPAVVDLRADLLAHGRARNRLPVNYQLQMLQKDLKDAHGGADVRAHFTPDAANREIHGAVIYPPRRAGGVSLDPLAGLPLRSLSLAQCSGLAGDLSALSGMPLATLNLSECTGLRGLRGLEGAPLRSLDLTDCTGLQDASALRGLKLTSLSAAASPGLKDLECLRGMPLKSLSIAGFGDVKDLSALAESQITSLKIDNCGIESLEGVEGLKLTAMSISDCPRLAGIAPLEGMPLKRLSLSGCAALTGDLSALKAARLTELDLTGCAALTGLKGIEGQPIESLNCSGCANLTGDLAALAGTVIVTLDLTGCRSLTGLKGIENLPVTALSLAGCSSLPDGLAPLKRLRLGSLDISDCTNLTSLAGLEGVPLKTLTATGCRKLTGDLAALRGSKLTDLDLSGCGELTSLKGIEPLPLRNLDLWGCTKLTPADYQRLERNTTLVTFRPGAKGLGGAILKAIADRRAKAAAARNRKRKPRR